MTEENKLIRKELRMEFRRVLAELSSGEILYEHELLWRLRATEKKLAELKNRLSEELQRQYDEQKQYDHEVRQDL
jgi:hypothetical protein